MICAVSYEGIEWSLDFGPDSVIPTAKYLVQEKTKSAQENRLPVWNLLFSQRQEFLDKHLAQIPITPNQQGTIEMREEVLASAGAQDMDNNGYELPDLEDIEFWENPEVELDAVFRPRIDTPFSTTAFKNLDKGEGGSSKNPIMLDGEEDKNSPPASPGCSEVVLLEHGLKMCHYMFIGLCLNNLIVCVCNIIYI